jgi:hypothetical protein
LREDFDHDIERGLRVVPVMHVGLDEGDVDTPLGRQSARFALRRRRKVDRQHVETLFGEPDAVAPLPVGDGERSPGRRQQMFAGFQKFIRLFAEGIFPDGEPSLPPFILVQK